MGALRASLRPFGYVVNHGYDFDGLKHVHPLSSHMRQAAACFAPDRILYLMGDPGGAVRSHWRRGWGVAQRDKIAPYLQPLLAPPPRGDEGWVAQARSDGTWRSLHGYCNASVTAGRASVPPQPAVDLMGVGQHLAAWLRLYGAAVPSQLDGGLSAALSSGAGRAGTAVSGQLEGVGPALLRSANVTAPVLFLHHATLLSFSRHVLLTKFLGVPAAAARNMKAGTRTSTMPFAGHCGRELGEAVDSMYATVEAAMMQVDGLVLVPPGQGDVAEVMRETLPRWAGPPNRWG